jgi:cellulose synthase/poly-beta-1,6-N-acetylglucosamine synthase-like glycosyltransferase
MTAADHQVLRADNTAYPRVSVILPVFQAVDEIGRAVESLLALDWPQEQLEILIVDNGSTDGTAAAVSRYPVTVLHENEVQSSYAARNRGLAAATGEWLAFTDSDCVVQPDWLRSLLLPAPAPEVGAVAGEVLALELLTPVQRLVEQFGIMKHAVTLPHKILPCFSTANVAVRRDLLADLSGFRADVRYFADMELSWRLQIEKQRTILFRPEAVIRHRHRRTWGALWRQGVQHGRGTAFMKRTYPDHYSISAAEQVHRLAGLARAALAAVSGGRLGGATSRAAGPLASSAQENDIAAEGSRQTDAGDRLRGPLFLALWYGGLLSGYLMGPARSSGTKHPASSTPGAGKEA